MGKQNIQAKNSTRFWTADEGTTLSLRNRRFQKGMSASMNGARERDTRGFSFEDDYRGGHLTLAYSLKIDTLESFTADFFSPKELVHLFLLKEVKPSPRPLNDTI